MYRAVASASLHAEFVAQRIARFGKERRKSRRCAVNTAARNQPYVHNAQPAQDLSHSAWPICLTVLCRSRARAFRSRCALSAVALHVAKRHFRLAVEIGTSFIVLKGVPGAKCCGSLPAR